MRPALGALAAIFVWLIAPFWMQEGMFMDGAIYASVAQNLANGIGTFWAPIYQPSSIAPYSEQLPMFMGMESPFFRLMGATPWTERSFMLLAWLTTAGGIWALQKLWWPEHPRETVFWILSIWSSAPLVGWGMGNHVQEMWMAPFTLWSVVAMSSARWFWLGGLLTVAAALFKGPQGLFPLVWLPVVGGLRLLPPTVALRRFGVVMAAVLVSVVGLWFWEDARDALVRNAANRLVRTFTEARAVTTSDRFWLLGPMLGQWSMLLGASLLVGWIRFNSLRPSRDRKVLAMLAVGLSASLPLMVTHEQRDFYLITSLGFVAVGLGNLWSGIPALRSSRLAIGFGLLTLVGLATLPWRRVERDPVLRASLETYKNEFAPGSAFNVAPELRLNHELAAYAMRYYRWEVDLANERSHSNVVRIDPAHPGGVVFGVKAESIK